MYAFRINGTVATLKSAGYFIVTHGMLFADTEFLCFPHRLDCEKISFRILSLTLCYSFFDFSALPYFLMSVLFLFLPNIELATMRFGLKSNATIQPSVETFYK